MSFPESLSEIMDLINQIIQYEVVRINQTPITISSVILFFFVFIVFYLLSRFIVRGLLRRILTRFQIEEGVQYTMRRVTHYLITAVGALLAFQFVGVDLSGLAVIFGLLSVGIGFGLQNVTSNFVAGLILLFERPIGIGDRVTVGDTEGDVIAINMRSTTIRSLDNIAIIVPNSEFVSSNVVNWSHGDPKTRINVEVGVSYASDLDTVLRALREVAEEHPYVLDEPEPNVLLTNFGDSSWNMKLRAWIANPKRYWVTLSEINCAIVRKFREYDIEIPFPQRDLHVRSPLPVPFHQESGGAPKER
jgi:small-conductance mechanosensitive channel